ncbi:MAG: hypothetical protein LBU07_07325 [Coriobacteriales bacterium]|jgi:D-aspartate ligase|nr:hypothetical protein [Coriobacteriales bacterium]
MPHTAGNRDFVPLLLGGDINVYSMARAFNEAYDMVCAGFGMAKSGVCLDSRILNYRSCDNADQPSVLASLLTNFATSHSDRKVLLVPVGDNYICSLAAIRDRLPSNIVDFGITTATFDMLTNKASFYDLCQRHGLPCPSTHVLAGPCGIGPELERLTIPLPWVIKPATGVDYWRHPFEGQEKVYRAHTRIQAQELAERIYAAGYPGPLVIQGYICGDDSNMWVLTTYSSAEGQLRLSCMGQVLLEEHTPKGLGNHAVIISRQERETELRMRQFLEDIGYRGPANLDFKWDKSTGRLLVLECNVRQGRSNYYVTASGVNLARLIAEDMIYGRRSAYQSVDRPTLWLVVPRQVAFDHTPAEPYHAQMRALIAHGRVVNPLLNPADNGLKHRLRVQRVMATQPDKFQRYYQREQM